MKINYKRLFLKNGLEVIIIQRPEQYTACTIGFFKAGSVFETYKTSGASHFVEHLLFRGNQRYKTIDQIDRQREKLGLSAGANTNYDYVRYYAYFPPQELAQSLEFISFLLFTSTLAKAEIEKERQVMFEEARLREDNLGIRAWDLTLKTRLKNAIHPLALPREGTFENIKQISASTLSKFYSNHFKPNNLTLVIGSPLNLKEVETVVRIKLEHFPSGEKLSQPQFRDTDFSKFKIVAETRDVEQIYLYLTIPTFSFKIPLKKRLAINLLNRILSQNRLIKKFYEEEGLSYDWGVSWSVPAHPIGFLSLYSSCAPKNLEKIIKIFLEELIILKQKGITTEELERSCDYSNKTQAMDFDSLTGSLEWFLEGFYFFDKFYSPNEIIEKRNSLTKEFINQIAKEIINFENLNICALGQISANSLTKISLKLLSLYL